MPRFFIKEEDLVFPDHIIIRGEDEKHIKNVLRHRIGDNITICDGKKYDYHVCISKYDVEGVFLSIVSIEENKTEPEVDVTLFQGLPKSDKMDLIIQKSVEMGVKRIVPIICERSVVKISERDVEKRVERWNKIALEASKQCNRGSIPRVLEPMPFCECVNTYELGAAAIPYEKEFENGLRTFIAYTRKEAKRKLSIFIGPEGGFSQDEIELAIVNGIMPVTLGPRILRTETAGIAVLSIIMYELGDANL